MDWLFAALAGIGFVEVLLRVPFWRVIAEFRATVEAVLRVLRSSRISDHWKERVLPRYAGRMLRQTMVLAGLLVAAFLPALLLTLVSAAAGTDFAGFAAAWQGIVFMTVLASAYAIVRVRLGR